MFQLNYLKPRTHRVINEGICFFGCSTGYLRLGTVTSHQPYLTHPEYSTRDGRTSSRSQGPTCGVTGMIRLACAGVEHFTAILVLSEVGDICKFGKEKDYVSCMELASNVPVRGEDTDPPTSPGNKKLRWVSVECGQAAVRFNPWFWGLYERVSKRRGAGWATVAHEMAG